MASGVLSVYDPVAALSLDSSMLREATECRSVVAVSVDPRTRPHNLCSRKCVDRSLCVVKTTSERKVFDMSRGRACNTGCEG